MEWELQQGDSVRGPLTEEEVSEAIQRGLAPTTRARPVGTEKWRPIGAHEPFAEALQSLLASARPQSAPKPTKVPLWVSIVLCTVALSVLVTAVFSILVFQQSRATGAVVAEKMPLLDSHLQAIESMARESSAAEFVTPDKTELTCIATNSEVTCSATNRAAVPIHTCVRGKLSKKQANALAVYSLPMCTGRLGQFESKTLSAPWKGAFAKDLCSTKTAYGTEVLDWNECDFNTEAIGAL